MSAQSLLVTLVAGRAAILQLAGGYLPFSRLVALHAALGNDAENLALTHDIIDRRGRSMIVKPGRSESADDHVTPAAARVSDVARAGPSRIQRALGKAEITRSVYPPERPSAPVVAPVAEPVASEPDGAPAVAEPAGQAVEAPPAPSEPAAEPLQDPAAESAGDAEVALEAGEPEAAAAEPEGEAAELEVEPALEAGEAEGDESAAPEGAELALEALAVESSPAESLAAEALPSESLAGIDPEVTNPVSSDSLKTPDEPVQDEPTPAEASIADAESAGDGLLVEPPSLLADELDRDVADPPSLTRVPAHRAAPPEDRVPTAPPEMPKISPPLPPRARPPIVVQAGPPSLPPSELEPLDEQEPSFGAPRAVAAVVAGVRASGPSLEEEAIGSDDDEEEMASIGVSAPGGGIQLGGSPKRRTASEPSAAPRLTDEEESPATDVAQSPNIKMAGDDGRIAQLLDDAIMAAGRSDLAKAIQAYTDVVDLRHDRSDAYIGRGRAYLELGDYSSAMSDFQRAEDLQPDRPDSHVAMGDLYFARKEYRRAIEFYDQAVELDGSHAMARCRRGISHYYRKNYRQAFQDLQRAYSLDPEIPNIRKYVQMAVKKMERGD